MGDWIAEKLGTGMGHVIYCLSSFFSIENFWLGCLGVIVAPIVVLKFLMVTIGPGIGFILWLVLVAAAIAGRVYLKRRRGASGGGSSMPSPGTPASQAELELFSSCLDILDPFRELLSRENRDATQNGSDLRSMCLNAGIAGERIEEASALIWRTAAVPYLDYIQEPVKGDALKQVGSQLALQNPSLGQHVDHFDQWMTWLSEAYNGNPQELPGGRSRTRAPLLPDEILIWVEEAEYFAGNGMRLDSGTIAITDRHVYYAGSPGNQHDFRVRYDEMILPLNLIEAGPYLVLSIVRTAHESSPDLLRFPDLSGSSVNDYLKTAHIRGVIDVLSRDQLYDVRPKWPVQSTLADTALTRIGGIPWAGSDRL